MAYVVDRRPKYCPRCVVERSSGERYCNLCGTELKVKPSSCPCGAPRSYYDKFCGFCGLEVPKEERKVLQKLDEYCYSYGDEFM